MKKLTKLSLKQLADEMPVIESENQLTLLGGGDGTINNPYTYEEMNWMISSGSWGGGYVEGMVGYIGYVSSEVLVSGALGGTTTNQTWSDISSLEQGQNNVGWFEGAMISASAFIYSGGLSATLSALGVVNAASDLQNDFTQIKNLMNDQGIDEVRVAYKIYNGIPDGCMIEWSYYNLQTGEKIYTRWETF